MNIMIYLILITVLIIVVDFIAHHRGNKAKKIVMDSNPVDGIRFGGVMGFELGDSYEFCLSRFKHLNLNINEDDISDDSVLGHFGNQYVIWGRDEYNHIKEVSFCFDKKILNGITIFIDFTEEGKKEMYRILVSRLSMVLGQEPMAYTEEFAKWNSYKGDVYLSIYPNSFSGDDKEERLIIQILP